MKILNFGSLNIDYVYSVEHFVKPGETISAKKLETFCGGKGLNQSVALARAGACAYHAGSVGKEGGMLIEQLKDAGADTGYVRIGDGPSGHAVIQVDNAGENCIIINGGANHTIGEEFIDRVMAGFEPGDICLTQNELNNVPCILRSAHRRGVKVAFNPSPFDRDILNYPLDCVSWFILNEVEGEGITGETEPEAIAQNLLSRYPQCRVVLTLGKEGVLYRDRDTAASHGIYKVKAVDTTGAGDTFTGYFLAGISQGLELEEILTRASVASSLAVSKKGAASSIPRLDEVLASHLVMAE